MVFLSSRNCRERGYYSRNSRLLFFLAFGADCVGSHNFILSCGLTLSCVYLLPHRPTQINPPTLDFGPPFLRHPSLGMYCLCVCVNMWGSCVNFRLCCFDSFIQRSHYQRKKKQNYETIKTSKQPRDLNRNYRM